MSDRPRGRPRSRSRSRDRYRNPNYDERQRRDDRDFERHRDSDRTRIDRRQSFQTGPSYNREFTRRDDRGRASIGSGDRRNFQADFRSRHGGPDSSRNTFQSTERKQNENIELLSNFFELVRTPGWLLYQYSVTFEPSIDSKSIRCALLNSHSKILPVKAFDGSEMFTFEKLPSEITELECIRNHDNQKVIIRIRLATEIQLGQKDQYDNEDVNLAKLLSIVFRRSLYKCKLIQFGKQAYFDFNNLEMMRQYHLKIAPGFKTSINVYKSNVLLCTEVIHKLISTKTVFDEMNEIFNRSSESRWKEECGKKLIGSTVMASYNFRSYRIDDIDWEQTPLSSFKKKDGSITFVDYYYQNYQLKIKEVKQPLLLVRVKDKKNHPNDPDKYQIIYLIPSLCLLAGSSVSNEINKDFRMKRDLDAVTKLNVDMRINRLKSLINLVRQNKEAKENLDQWQMSINPDLVKCNAMVLKSETIILKNTEISSTERGWNNIIKDGVHIESVPLKDWILIFHPRDQNKADFFMREIVNISRPMGFRVSNGQMYRLQDRGTNSFLFVNAINESVRKNPQMIVCILPNSAKDTYDAIKKVCCVETGIPSQCITSNILDQSKGGKAKSAITKIAVQMNCKLGGVIWGVKILTRNTMVVGIDSFKDSSKRNHSVFAFVSTTNGTDENTYKCTKYFSRCIIKSNEKEEEKTTSVVLKNFMIDALNAYFKKNNTYPDKIFIFRDGVSEGKFLYINDSEIPSVRLAFSEINPNYKPNYAFIIVNKRGNARFFYKKDDHFQNPPAGTVVDKTVVKNDGEFYLIPQSADRGTVAPSHFFIIDGKNMTLDLVKIQTFTYKLTHLYYNWPGQIRIPAILQYASKLARLVGESIHRPHSPSLDDKLFYL